MGFRQLPDAEQARQLILTYTIVRFPKPNSWRIFAHFIYITFYFLHQNLTYILLGSTGCWGIDPHQLSTSGNVIESTCQMTMQTRTRTANERCGLNASFLNFLEHFVLEARRESGRSSWQQQSLIIFAPVKSTTRLAPICYNKGYCGRDTQFIKRCPSNNYTSIIVLWFN